MRQGARDTGIKLRVERTFLDEAPEQFKCAVAERSNLMFLPDGRVFMCMMFIDVPNSHSFYWDGHFLHPHLAPSSETTIVQRHAGAGCAAMPLVNAEIAATATLEARVIDCIYAKAVL
jgi:hypothetical protein